MAVRDGKKWRIEAQIFAFSGYGYHFCGCGADQEYLFGN